MSPFAFNIVRLLEILAAWINLSIRKDLQVLNSHMNTAIAAAYNARKEPRQARSTMTVEAILEATIQVLLADGTARLTTTSVANRAGVSVGTLYQYYPNKQSLFFAVNENYLDMLARRVEAACRDQHGKPYAEMAAALVETYVKVKTERRDMTRVLYLAAGEINVAGPVEMMTRRIEAASEAMFATASDGPFENLATLNLTILNVLFGTVRSFFDRNMSDLLEYEFSGQIVWMFCAYLGSAKMRSVGSSTAA
jgi:AcrR family transcriptional regulator